MASFDIFRQKVFEICTTLDMRFDPYVILHLFHILATVPRTDPGGEAADSGNPDSELLVTKII